MLINHQNFPLGPLKDSCDSLLIGVNQKDTVESAPQNTKMQLHSWLD